MRANRTWVILLHLLLSKEALSQTSRSDPNDKQARYGASVTLDLPKKWEISIGYQARYRNDFRDFRGDYLTLATQKEVFKTFSILAEYRIAWLNNSTYQRLTGGFNYKKKLDKVKLGLRGLIQNQMEEFDDAGKEGTHDLYWRVKLSVQYPVINRLAAYASVEPVMMVNGIHFVDNWRCTAGLMFKATRQLDIEVYYLNKQDYSKSYNRTFDIVGLGLDYTFKIVM